MHDDWETVGSLAVYKKRRHVIIYTDTNGGPVQLQRTERGLKSTRIHKYIHAFVYVSFDMVQCSTLCKPEHCCAVSLEQSGVPNFVKVMFQTSGAFKQERDQKNLSLKANTGCNVLSLVRAHFILCQPSFFCKKDQNYQCHVTCHRLSKLITWT